MLLQPLIAALASCLAGLRSALSPSYLRPASGLPPVGAAAKAAGTRDRVRSTRRAGLAGQGRRAAPRPTWY